MSCSCAMRRIQRSLLIMKLLGKFVIGNLRLLILRCDRTMAGYGFNHKLQIINHKSIGWCCHLTRQQAGLTIRCISLSINNLRYGHFSGDGGQP